MKAGKNSSWSINAGTSQKKCTIRSYSTNQLSNPKTLKSNPTPFKTLDVSTSSKKHMKNPKFSQSTSWPKAWWSLAVQTGNWNSGIQWVCKYSLWSQKSNRFRTSFPSAENSFCTTTYPKKSSRSTTSDRNSKPSLKQQKTARSHVWFEAQMHMSI